jgi:hypothetical protein
MIEILMGAVTQETNPVSGRSMNRRADVVNREQMIDRLWFEATKTEDVPTEYYVPITATAALNLLRAHGIQLRRITEPIKGVEQFTITSNTQRPVTNSIDLGSHGLRTLDGSWQPSDATVPINGFAVAMNQPLARLAFYLLAPTSDDGLTNWNFLDPWLGPDSKVYPIYRRK